MPGGRGGDAVPLIGGARSERLELTASDGRRRGSAEATWSADELAKLADELRGLRRGSGLKRTLALGELLLERLFSGEPGGWHNRRRNKACSIRRLAKSRGCPFSKSALTEALSVYVASKDLADLAAFRHVQLSHVLSVLPLPAPQRTRLLEQAERHRWSVRTLRQQVALLRGANTSSVAVDPVTTFHSALDELAETARRVSASMPPKPAGAVFGDLAHELSQFKARLEALRGACSPGPSRELHFTATETGNHSTPTKATKRRAYLK
jgi:hypothetical protein